MLKLFPHLDYLSCALTVASKVMIGKRLWQVWVLAGANSVIICLIGLQTAQFGFVPANAFCLALSANNFWRWREERKASQPQAASR